MTAKFKRNYLIDREYQLRTTFSVIGLVTVITALIIGLIGYNVFSNNENINNIYEIENNIVNFLTSGTNMNQDESYQQAINTMMKKHHKNMETLQTIMSYNKILLAIIFALLIIEAILLYGYLIRKPHKISGPIYVMTLYLNDIIKGINPRIRNLRDGDELVEFHALFVKMIDKIKSNLK